VSEASEHIQYLEFLNTLDPGFHRGDEYSVILSKPPFTKGRSNHPIWKGKVWKRGETVLLLLYVDEKNAPENVVLGIFIEPRFSSPLNLLGRDKEAPS
jgi:hypothetical protein